jgi:uncharacterized RDD family membrane protein YckC
MSNVPPPPPPGGGFPQSEPAGGGFAPPPPPSGGYAPQGGYTPAGQAGGAAGMPLANFGQRLGALIIDGLIVAAMQIPAYIALVAGPKKIEACSSNIADFEGQLCEVPNGTTWALFAILLIAAVVAGIAYWAKMDGAYGTVGKKALKIRVVDANTGQPMGTGRGVGRYFARILSGFLCGLGYLWMLWDDRSQTWHDKIVSTVVVQTQ